MIRYSIYLLILLLMLGTVRGEDFPIALGAGSDTVFLKTGVSPDWDKHLSLHPPLCAFLRYDTQMRVREITLVAAADDGMINLLGDSPAPVTPHLTLAGIAPDDQEESVLAKLGEPASRTVDPVLPFFDTKTYAWLRQDTLLIISFLRTEQKEAKHIKGAVVRITLRKANL